MDRPGEAADSYRHWVNATYGRWMSVTTPIHATFVDRPRRIAALSATLTAPVIGKLIASTWAIYWNNLTDGAIRTPAVVSARAVHHLGRAGTVRSRLRRSLQHDLEDRTWR